MSPRRAARASWLHGSWLPALALALAACGSRRAPRPTLLNAPPPVPEPGSDEARLMPVELRPDASEAPETAPGHSLHTMARRALDEAQSSIVRCYEELLVRNPAAAGSFEVQLDLSSDGAVTRTHLDHRGDGGIEAMQPCLRDVFAAVRVRDVAPHGQYVSRVYTFSNPPVERAVQAAVVVTAPPRTAPARVARVRGRRGAPPTPPTPAAVEAPPSTPRAGPGSLRAEELTRGLTDVPALRACAALALAPRRGRRSPGAGAVHFTVAADGSVSEARYETVPPGPAADLNVATCVADAVRALRFRASGIAVHAQVPLTFRR